MHTVLIGRGPIAEAVRPTLRRWEEASLVEVGDVDRLDEVVRTSSVDWLVSAGAPYIVPGRILDAVGDSVNVHPSYLPWGRGSAPNVWAIVNGEPAGVTAHRMVREVDAGPIFAQRAVDVSPVDTGGTLHQKLIAAAGELFASLWPRLRAGEVEAWPQTGSGSFYTDRDLRDLTDLRPDQTVTWERALNVLRALTFEGYDNVTLTDGDETYVAELRLRPARAPHGSM